MKTNDEKIKEALAHPWRNALAATPQALNICKALIVCAWESLREAVIHITRMIADLCILACFPLVWLAMMALAPLTMRAFVWHEKRRSKALEAAREELDRSLFNRK